MSASRVLVAMSGGVDSSVAAALLVEAGYDVAGVTLKLWGGESDTGCCSLADVTDARRVADQLGIAHHVFNFTDGFDEHVVAPYVAAHARGETPNPCAECNRHLKFDALLSAARRLGFSKLATGHHARSLSANAGRAELWRGRDRAKDQSYVLSMLAAEQLRDIVFPVGELEKSEVRAVARRVGLRVADKPDSQDVCFINRRGDGAGHAAFLAKRMALHPGRVLDSDGRELGTVEAIELVTVGQRHGLLAGGGERMYAVSVDVAARAVVVGEASALCVEEVELRDRSWVDGPRRVGTPVLVQSSAHGAPIEGRVTDAGVAFCSPTRRVAPGQLVALYEHDQVVGSGVVS